MILNYQFRINSAISAGLLGLSLFIYSTSSIAFSEACELVASSAGSAYQTAPLKLASTTAPEQMPVEFELNFSERNNAWFIYESTTLWFASDGCGPMSKAYATQTVEFLPVIKNNQLGQYLVVSSNFIIQTYSSEDLELLAERYDFKLHTLLPSGDTAVFDVGVQASYDQMLELFESDTTIKSARPLLAERRYQLR